MNLEDALNALYQAHKRRCYGQIYQYGQNRAATALS